MSRFRDAVWQTDRMLLDQLVFRLEHFRNDAWELGDECFRFYKIKPLIDQYEQFWARRPAFSPAHVVELGIWDGGGAAFWFEMLQPRKLVALDLSTRGDSQYFRRYVTDRNLAGRLNTHWGVNQADRARLRTLIADEFPAPLDLVIDDASHIYEPTKASFEVLFPFLRPGGLYVLEDWAWAHWSEFQGPGSPYAGLREPTRLIWDLVEAVGTSAAAIANLSVFQGFAVVERGQDVLPSLKDFNLDQAISRRAPQDSLRNLARRAWGEMLRRLKSGRLRS